MFDYYREGTIKGIRGQSPYSPYYQPTSNSLDQFRQEYDAFMEDPSMKNLEDLISLVNKLENDFSISSRNRDALLRIKDDLQHYQQLYADRENMRGQIQMIQEDLKKPDLTSNERKSLETQIQQKEDEMQLLLNTTLSSDYSHLKYED